ncbi:MAG: transaldolase [Candidatus Omnitrophica bacterium CG1_02_44_16]|nr:MAG: transaldolase [Candidatus Omnitrophica bacterium CG1_02_44_16]PIY81985.1 MAG: transaldolase [Candidatus Omnitrophica bacterium CG_4_10_14_0_8_um_filter_44_12]PIZ84098.1 MAG: transaldolase [Candidatus Omnitrophica bacterium CG_4_10_14_0_2_um_filter_44_9]
MSDTPVNKLNKLRQLGQSPWYDNIDRRLIDSGELKSFFDMGIVGVTSNPTIFEKAINGSVVYDEKIKRLKKEGKSLEAIYDDLTADDVRDAADMLSGVYDRTEGLDGYVSIEVLPTYAHDPEKTLEYARYIHKKVGRKNIMIKVPGTPQASSAIRALIAEGISVNVTLLFSVEQYEPAALAYMDGLRDRLRLGLDLKSVSSVASVFISRIDTKVDNILDVLINREAGVGAGDKVASLRGKIAIANAKFIYRRFKELFDDRIFGELKAWGGRAQRPLWASTSSKNPAYSACIYVDNLIGPLTVNTMPHQTVSAFAGHGRVALTLESDLGRAEAYALQLSELGVNLATICDEAQKEGILVFGRSFDTLMASLKAKVG